MIVIERGVYEGGGGLHVKNLVGSRGRFVIETRSKSDCSGDLGSAQTNNCARQTTSSF